MHKYKKNILIFSFVVGVIFFYKKISFHQVDKSRYRSFLNSNGRTSVPCPEDAVVIAVIGQSNAANHVNSKFKDPNNFRAFNFFDEKCYLIEDPNLGATGNGGSIWTYFSTSLANVLNKNVVIINNSIKGTSVEDWSRDKYGFFSKFDESLKQIGKYGFKLSYLIWLQGEKDSQRKTTPEDYLKSFNDLFYKIKKNPAYDLVNSKTFIFQTSVCHDGLKSNIDILNAQAKIAESHSDVHLVMNTDELGAEYRYDGCHFNFSGVDKITKKLIENILTIK